MYSIITNSTGEKYGIASYTGEKTPLIISSKNDAEKLLELICKTDLSPEHINDVVRDFVIEQIYNEIF